MVVSVFIGTSVDGFIARPNGDLDFLPAGGEPHGYDDRPPRVLMARSVPPSRVNT